MAEADWLNYHHLLYFWVVAREGSVTAAAKRLRLAQPTISGQLRLLEERVGEPLFARQGRGLELTEMGRAVFRYADEIFSLGRELQEVVRGRPTGRPMRLAVGVTDALPKMVVARLIEPGLTAPDGVRLVVREDRPERLLADLATHELDLVLADMPLGPGMPVRAYEHPLGETPVAFFAAPSLAHLAAGFPASLDDAPFLWPATGTALHRSLARWFEANRVAPRFVGELEDSALLKAFGQRGLGVFAAPAVVADEVVAQYAVIELGRSEEVRERFWAITVERRIVHPGTRAIVEGAAAWLRG